LKTRIAIGAGLAALGVVAVTLAHAQTVPGNPPGAEAQPMAQPGLAPRDVLRVVRASGLTPLTQPSRRGQHYMVLASDNMGGQLRVVIGAFDGRIVHAAPARDPRFAAYPVRPRGYVPIAPQYGAGPGTSRGMAPPPDLREPSAPLPRAAARAPVPRPPANTPQDPRLASAPDVTGSVPTRPTRTPLPRPRPAAAANEATSQTTPPAPAAAVAATAPAAPAERPAASPPAAAPKPAPAQPTEMVPVAPLD
jgi:hypothetical protein